MGANQINTLRKASLSMAALIALIASPAASAQVSCPLNGYALDVFLPGGGAWVVQSYNSLTLLEAPNAPIAMGV
ncbi:MAG TPA: hypothetical protein VN878_06295, partial [Usitatibacter sp.]|nr:hypothetical protein [Usitatibacter sp.]